MPTTTRKRYYVEFRNGNCAIIEASRVLFAREQAEDFVRAFRNGGVTIFREATQDDLDDFRGAIYQAL